MASTYSDLKFELIGTGEQSGTWGTTTNTNLGTAIQEAITGSADVTFASGTVTLTLTDTNATQTARNLRLNLTGTSGGAQNLIVPTIEKFYVVNNGVADAITVKNSTGTGIAVPTGKAMLLFNDGTNVVEAITYATTLAASGANSDITSLSGLTTALSIAQGGTGATTADTALDNLGGTTVGKGVFKAATAAAAQQAMDTEVGVDVQAYDADLTALGGLAKTDGNIIVGDGTTWVAESGATARTSLGLGSIATQASSSVSITGGSITGITDLAVADGGTGQGSYTDGELLIGNTTGNTLTKATLTAGTGISVTNGSGAITIASTGGGGFSNMEVFTSSGTWTNPGSVTTVKVTVTGGGGNGGACPGGNPSGPVFGAGGAGGGTAIGVETIPTAPVAVTVGGAAGTSSFGAFISATGGATGASRNPSNVVTNLSSGVGSGGQVAIKGGYAGGDRNGGGASITGLAVGLSGAGSAPGVAANADAKGAGGGGASQNSQTTATYTGGAGAGGIVIVEW
jgi:hypothetical protein